MKAIAKVSVSISLPTERSVPKSDLLQYSYLFFGRKKIGKTTLAAQFPDAFFLMTEPGAENLRVYQRAVADWNTFVSYLDLLDENRKRFKTVVLDIADPLYDFCLRQICKDKNLEHPNEAGDYGQTWKKVNSEFEKQCSRLLPMNSGRGLVLISHEKSKEIDVVGEDKPVERIIPTMERHCMEYFNGKVDMIAYYCFKKSKRKIIIQGDEFLEAGCRCEENFLNVSGEKLISFPAGNSAKESYKIFEDAFNNKLSEKGGEKAEENTQEKVHTGSSQKKVFKRLK
jgi:hypothetical protein